MASTFLVGLTIYQFLTFNYSVLVILTKWTLETVAFILTEVGITVDNNESNIPIVSDSFVTSNENKEMEIYYRSVMDYYLLVPDGTVHKDDITCQIISHCGLDFYSSQRGATVTTSGDANPFHYPSLC